MREIKLHTTASGPDGVWHPGKHSVPDEFAADLVAGKFAEHAVVGPSEKAVVQPPQKAVVKPSETAKGITGTEPVKPPVAAPASSGNTVASNKAATWGTPEVKK
jgi:hypothetical protein